MRYDLFLSDVWEKDTKCGRLLARLLDPDPMERPTAWEMVEDDWIAEWDWAEAEVSKIEWGLVSAGAPSGGASGASGWSESGGESAGVGSVGVGGMAATSSVGVGSAASGSAGVGSVGAGSGSGGYSGWGLEVLAPKPNDYKSLLWTGIRSPASFADLPGEDTMDAWQWQCEGREFFKRTVR